jgi:undecaprenyl pyrophosphate phosphatase UppP
LLIVAGLGAGVFALLANRADLTPVAIYLISVGMADAAVSGLTLNAVSNLNNRA